MPISGHWMQEGGSVGGVRPWHMNRTSGLMCMRITKSQIPLNPLSLHKGPTLPVEDQHFPLLAMRSTARIQSQCNPAKDILELIREKGPRPQRAGERAGADESTLAWIMQRLDEGGVDWKAG